MNTPVSTTNITASSAIDEILGNQVIAGIKRTRRAQFADFSQQLLGSGPLATALGAMVDAVKAGRIYFTFDQLQASTGATSGSFGEVIGDGDNNGIYKYNGTTWLKISELDVDSASSYRDEAQTAAGDAQAALTAAEAVAAGISLLTASAPFSGTFSGSSAAITLPASPASGAQVLLFVGGIPQDPSVFAVSGTTLTLPEMPPNGVGYMGFVMASSPILTLPLASRATIAQMLAGSDDGLWASALKVFQFYQSIGDRWWLGLAGQLAATNDTTLASAITAGGSSLFVADKETIAISNPALLAPGIFDPRSPAILSILGATVPMGDIVDSLTINVGGSAAFQSPDDVRKYLHDRSIRPNAFVTVQVADGTYSIPEFYCCSPDFTRVRFIGNEATPANCVLSFDATSNQNGLHADGCILRIRGFEILGIGAAGATRIDWNVNCYGAGAMAYGSGSRIELENAMRFVNFYYSALADAGGMIGAAYASTVRAGDVAFLARKGGVINASHLDIQTVAHHDGFGAVLGFGVLAEQGSAEATLSVVTDCEVAGLAAHTGGSLTAFGTNSHHNVGYGARALSHGVINLSVEPSTNTPCYLTFSEKGAYVAEGGILYCNGNSTAANVVQNNNFDGIHCFNNGEAHVNYVASGFNGDTGGAGYGFLANGANAQILAGNITYPDDNKSGHYSASGGGIVTGA